VQVDSFRFTLSFARNRLEFGVSRALSFLALGQTAFSRVQGRAPVPASATRWTLEYLARVASTVTESAVPRHNSSASDSHTTMVNGLGVPSLGVGGIEGRAAMPRPPLSILLPKVSGSISPAR